MTGHEVIGAEHASDKVLEAAQDAILIQARHFEQGLLNGRFDVSLLVMAALYIIGRRQPRAEIFEKQAGNSTMLDQRLGHISIGEGNARLPQIAPKCPQQSHLAPAETFLQHERIIAVIFSKPLPDRQKGRAHELKPFRLGAKL